MQTLRRIVKSGKSKELRTYERAECKRENEKMLKEGATKNPGTYSKCLCIISSCIHKKMPSPSSGKTPD
ncbi:hypothetical protein POVCU2_0041080 [Plasmodium ovale curtisi]|uniref:Uncharacterized protein n=1 Tax=Plasmodium ovale curtisi TaxID=864141 RepID=A0A1A8X146_PLAOA|nr:hypothetical protein POVCU2_0041080 [Plasmodium ovale curtisi]SBS97402.1 hypothetical protein POVCU1_037930 [Plasmodium ovale curtisi]